MARILQVAHYYGPLGGIERIVHQFCHGLSDEHEVTALVANTSAHTTDQIEDGVRVVRVGRWAHVARMSLCPGFPYWLRKLQADVIHVHMINPVAETACLLAHPRCPVVATYHMDATRQRKLLKLYQPVQRQFLRRLAWVTASSENLAKTSPVLERIPDKVRILPFGLAADQIRITPQSEAIRSKLQERHQNGVVLFVGRLTHYKGVSVLVEAMRDLEAECWIVGTGYLEQSIRQQIADYGLADRLVLLGRISDDELVARYQCADVFVLPSVNRTEAFGLTQLEAMSLGTPVISTEIGTGTSFVNQHDVSGLVIPPNHPAALREAINRILTEPGLKQRLSQGALERSCVFTEKKMIDQLKSFYRELNLTESRSTIG